MIVYVRRHRNANFVHINRLLREQLDQATAANQKLQMELHRVININKEYEEKEVEWRKEEQVSKHAPHTSLSSLG